MRTFKDLTESWRSSLSAHAEDAASSFLGFMEHLSATYYYGAMICSIIASVNLFFSDRRWESLFVGLWARTLLSVGLFYRMLRPARET